MNSALRGEPGGDGGGGAGVGGEGNLVYVADPHQGAHVGLVRLGGERVAEEDHSADLPQGHAGPNDQIAAVRAMGDAFDGEARFLGNQPARAAGGDERIPGEDFAVLADEFDQGGFFGVVGDEGEHHSGAGLQPALRRRIGQVKNLPHCFRRRR